MYWRRYRVSEIPTEEEKFKAWILDRWREKDDLLDYFNSHKHFPPSPAPEKSGPSSSDHMDWISTEVKPLHWFTWLQIYLPLTGLAAVTAAVTKILMVNYWNSQAK